MVGSWIICKSFVSVFPSFKWELLKKKVAVKIKLDITYVRNKTGLAPLSVQFYNTMDYAGLGKLLEFVTAMCQVGSCFYNEPITHGILLSALFLPAWR